MHSWQFFREKNLGTQDNVVTLFCRPPFNNSLRQQYMLHSVCIALLLAINSQFLSLLKLSVMVVVCHWRIVKAISSKYPVKCK